MSAIFRGTYHRLGSFGEDGALDPAAGTVALTPVGGSTVTATLDADGFYQTTLTTVAGPTRVTIVETLTDAPAVRTTSHVVTTGEVVDTSWEFHPTSSIDSLGELVAALAAKQDVIPAGTYAPTAKTFFVDSFLPGGLTPTTATAVQTLTAAQAAQDAAEAVDGVCKFTPGETYIFSDSFMVGSAVTIDCSGATLAKANPGTNGNLLMTNKSWASGNNDITILAHGATWDYNGVGQTTGGGNALGDCVHFQHCTRIRVLGRPLIKRALKYGFVLGNCEDWDCDGFTFDTHSDGFHGMSPSKRGHLGVCTGTTGDDFVAFSIYNYTDQIANLTANGETTLLGDVEDIVIDSLIIDNGHLATGATNYGAGLAVMGHSSDFKFRRFYVGSISGETGFAGKTLCRIENDGILTNLNIEDITIDKISGTVVASNLLRLKPSAARVIRIGQIVSTQGGALTPVEMTGGVIDRLIIGALDVGGAPTVAQVLIGATAECKHLSLSGISAIMGANGRVFQHSSTQPMVVTLNDFTISGVSAGVGWGWYTAVGSGVLTVNLGLGRFKNLLIVSNNGGGTQTVHINGAVFDTNTISWEINHATAVTRVVAGAITQVGSGDRNVTIDVAGKFTCTGPTFRADMSKVDVTTALAGDTFYNAVAGLLPVGPVVKDSVTGILAPVEPSTAVVSPKTASYTLLATDRIVTFNNTSLTATLPSAVSMARGKRFTIKNLHSTSLTIATTSSQTIDGAAPGTLAQWAKLDVVSDGANWLAL